MAEPDREQARKWRIVWRIIYTFGVAVNFYSLFFGANPEPESIWRFSPWPMAAVFFSLGLAFLLALVASSLSVISPWMAALWNFLIEPYRRAKRLEATRKQDVLSTMAYLRGFCFQRTDYVESHRGTYERIHRAEMENRGLALPEYATPEQWVVYLDRLMPFVETHGLRLAKLEAKKWKWQKPADEKFDDEVPF